MLESLIRDVRFALRTMQRSKLFALTAVAAFAFGITATATVLSLVDSGFG